MHTSPESGSGRRAPQLKLGWIALLVMMAGIAVSFLSIPVGFALVGVGATVLVVSLVLELRVRKAAERNGSAFAEGGTFGGRRSPQTHTKM